MHIQSLEDTPLIGVVLEMQREMSRARNESELIFGFVRRFREISGVSEVLDLAVADDRSCYRIMDRIVLNDEHASPDSMRANYRWDDPVDDVPKCSGGLIGQLVHGTDPKLARDLQPERDPALRDWIEGPRDALAVPVYYRGRIGEWLVVFRQPGLDIEPMQLRISISILNMLARSVHQLKLTRQVSDLRDRLERKLDEIAGAQQAILPEKLPQHPSLDVAVIYRPSDYASGDYYDFRSFPDGSLGFVIADVSGHGPGAAVVMAMMRTAMMIYRQLDAPIDETVQEINRLFVHSLGRGTFVTALFVRIDPDTGQLLYVNAGHCPALVRRCDQTIARLDAAGGPPLGIVSDFDVVGGEFRLAPGDTLVLYTDGVTETRNRVREQFGEHRLAKTLRSAAGGAESLVKALKHAIEGHSGGWPQSDDQCLVAVQYRA